MIALRVMLAAPVSTGSCVCNGLWAPATAAQPVHLAAWLLVLSSWASACQASPLCWTGTLTDYRITVYTSPFASAATDASVTAVLYGSTGTGHRMQLNPEPRGTAFTQGAVDAFTLESQQLGQLWKLHIGHDGKVGVHVCVGGLKDRQQAATGSRC